MSLDNEGGAPAPTEQQPTTPITPPPSAGEGGRQNAGSEGNLSLAQAGGEERTEPPSAEPRWRDDWRTAMFGGDESKAKRIARYASPEGVAKALIETQDRLRSGAQREPLPENPTPEQTAAWRKDNGIPATPEEYKIEPGDGLVFGETDKPMLEAFSKFAHERNWTPQQVNQGAAFVAQLQEQQRAARDAADQAAKQEGEHALMEEWGRELRPNLQNVRNLIDRHGEPGLADAIFSARDADGVALGNKPGLLRMLNTLAREINPLATVVPAGTQDGGKAAEAELAELRGKMGDRGSDYWQGPTAEKQQARYRELLTALEKQKGRG